MQAVSVAPILGRPVFPLHHVGHEFTASSRVFPVLKVGEFEDDTASASQVLG